MSTTVRLTMAQALVRFLAAQSVERDGQRASLLRRLLWHLRPRQRHRHRPGTRGAAGALDLLPGSQRAGHGPCRSRICQDAKPPRRARLHDLDRTGRDQHADRSRGRDHQPGPGAAASRRRFCITAPRPGPPAAGVPGTRRPQRERLLPTRVQVLGSHPAAGAARAGGTRGDARAHEPGRDRGGDARPAGGRADGSLRISARVPRGSRLAHRPAGTRCGRAGPCGIDHSRLEAAADHRRRRGHLLGGDRCAAPVRGSHGHSGRRDPGRQRVIAVRPPRRYGRNRRHWHLGRQPRGG